MKNEILSIFEEVDRNTVFTEFETFLKEKGSITTSTPGIKNIDSFQSMPAQPLASTAQLSPAPTPAPIPAVGALPTPSSQPPLLAPNPENNSDLLWKIVFVGAAAIVVVVLVRKAYKEFKKDKQNK